MSIQPNVITVSDIQSWMVTHLAKKLGLSEQVIDVEKSFASFGLDSISAYSFSGELAEWLNCEIDPTVFYDYPTIALLSQHLSKRTTLN